MQAFLKQYGVLVGALLLITGAVWYLEMQKPNRTKAPEGVSDISLEQSTDTTREARIAAKAKKYERVKEISSPDGFINTAPFALKDYVGKKVILVDFWTYSCINCKRTTPYLNTWYDKYEKDGFVIVGIHTPEFDFEKVYDNVKKATEQEKIKFPVVLDNDYSTWTAYKNQYWPRKYLIDIDGFIVYDHIGEGAYDETEAKIVDALNERAQTLGMGKVEMSGTSPTDVVLPSAGVSPETYLGFARSEYMANPLLAGCRDAVCDYTLPARIPSNTFGIEGKWTIKQEFARTEAKDASLMFSVRAKNVYLVGHGAQGAVNVHVLLDGKEVPASASGESLKNSTLMINDAKLYHVFSFPGVESHTLELKSDGPGLELFTFTFG